MQLNFLIVTGQAICFIENYTCLCIIFPELEICYVLPWCLLINFPGLCTIRFTSSRNSVWLSSWDCCNETRCWGYVSHNPYAYYQGKLGFLNVFQNFLTFHKYYVNEHANAMRIAALGAYACPCFFSVAASLMYFFDVLSLFSFDFFVAKCHIWQLMLFSSALSIGIFVLLQC